MHSNSALQDNTDYTQNFSFVPRSWHNDHYIFLISLPSLTFTRFCIFITTREAFIISDPGSTQDAYVYGLARHQSLLAQWLEHPTGS